MVSSLGNNTDLGKQAVDSQITTGGAVGSDGALSTQKDSKTASTDPTFGEVYKQIQSKYGAKAEKPREIKKTLGKDDFLKIMITQMKNQDPTSPFKAEQMATEMAQFTSVEQLQNVNQNLHKMATQNQPLERLAMTHLIGKVVTVDRERFTHMENSNESLTFNLPKDATTVKVTIFSDSGETILQKDLGPMKTGEQSFSWDGLKTNTLPAKTGNYMFRLEAKDERGVGIAIGSQGKARVVGVSFEGTEPVFLVGDARRQERVLMKNIIRIDTDGPLPESPSGGGSALISQKSPNFISFQKGVGSSNLDSSQTSPETAAALAKYQEAQTNSGSPRAAVPGAAPPAGQQTHAQSQVGPPPMGVGIERGFPNGLHDSPDPEEVKSPSGHNSAQQLDTKGGEKK